jgi:predicted PP-loop superfamily ATPase
MRLLTPPASVQRLLREGRMGLVRTGHFQLVLDILPADSISN